MDDKDPFPCQRSRKGTAYDALAEVALDSSEDSEEENLQKEYDLEDEEDITDTSSVDVFANLDAGDNQDKVMANDLNTHGWEEERRIYNSIKDNIFTTQRKSTKSTHSIDK